MYTNVRLCAQQSATSLSFSLSLTNTHTHMHKKCATLPFAFTSYTLSPAIHRPPPSLPSPPPNPLLPPPNLPQVDVSFTKQLGPFFEAMQQGRDRRTERREMTVAEARKALEESELESLTSQDVVIREAINAVEQDGIVFIDEIDKIVTSSGYRYGAFGWGW